MYVCLHIKSGERTFLLSMLDVEHLHKNTTHLLLIFKLLKIWSFCCRIHLKKIGRVKKKINYSKLENMSYILKRQLCNKRMKIPLFWRVGNKRTVAFIHQFSQNQKSNFFPPQHSWTPEFAPEVIHTEMLIETQRAVFFSIFSQEKSRYSSLLTDDVFID